MSGAFQKGWLTPFFHIHTAFTIILNMQGLGLVIGDFYCWRRSYFLVIRLRIPKLSLEWRISFFKFWYFDPALTVNDWICILVLGLAYTIFQITRLALETASFVKTCGLSSNIHCVVPDDRFKIADAPDQLIFEDLYTARWSEFVSLPLISQQSQ